MTVKWWPQNNNPGNSTAEVHNNSEHVNTTEYDL